MLIILSAQEAARLRDLQDQHLWTARAYQMRLTLQEIYEEEDPIMARQRLLDWCQLIRQTAQTLPKTIFASMLAVAKMIENHLEGIMAHWTHKVTNAYMEALNSVFSATKRKARGYRTIENLLTMLFLVAGKLPLPNLTH